MEIRAAVLAMVSAVRGKRIHAAAINATMHECAAVVDAPKAATGDVPVADLSAYTGDAYSRIGCTLVVHIAESKWSLRVYAPGYKPFGDEGCIEHYFPRRHGSTGIAIDAFIHGSADLRSVGLAMVAAERAYAASKSSVTL